MAHLPTTGAIVQCEGFRFGDDSATENPEVITMVANSAFNGPSPGGGIPVLFARNATRAVKATAIRNAVNAHVQSYEPGIPLLTDADIQISGLPI